MAAEENLPAVRGGNTAQYPYPGGIPRAVGANHSQHFTRLQINIDLFQYVFAAVGRAQIVNFQHVNSRSWPGGCGAAPTGKTAPRPGQSRCRLAVPAAPATPAPARQPPAAVPLRLSTRAAAGGGNPAQLATAECAG